MDSSCGLEYRKVQVLVGERSFSVVLPKTFVKELGIERGDFVKMHLKDGKIVIARAAC